jgi:hypothetical protein
MFSIGITTYKYRFEEYLAPLIKDIRRELGNEIILGINGEYNEAFDEEYRKEILNLSSSTPDLYPFVYPNFRSLAKMWNTIIINSSNDYVLVLNDDLKILDSTFFKEVDYHINRLQAHFTINHSYSHFVIRKSHMTEMTWFDERFLGIGCEDHDMRRRGIIYHNCNIGGLENCTDNKNCVIGQKIENGKYSLFNRVLLNQNIEPVAQYPHERFYLENRERL